MVLDPYCLCCQLNIHEKKIREFDDQSRKNEYITKVLNRLSNQKETDCAPSLSVELKEMFSEFWNIPQIDFTEIKKEFNQMILNMEEEIRTLIENSEDPLEAALIYSRIGNYIDFAAMANVEKDVVLDMLQSENKQPLNPEEYRHFLEELSQARSLVYLADNCGEIVFDKIVIELLQKKYPDLKITVLVRGFPAANDATMEDAEMVGLTALTTVVGNGSRIGGTWLSDISEEALSLLNDADLILSKGQGNFETLRKSGYNIYYLFLCKCELFTRLFNVNRFDGMFVNERRI
ncbi:MAG: ARMT1-like domain-containing protein [Eubacteriales bacterium]|nr:ARMT1-like domain-containing protein [Eubacteriales bacterium]